MKTSSHSSKSTTPDEELSYRGTPVYEILSEADVQRILDTTFQLMSEIGVAFDPDPRVLDRFADAGCDITSGNIVKHRRDNYWNSRYFGAAFPLSSSVVPDKELIERIDDDLREILVSHHPEPMPEAIRRQLGTILDKFETE